MKRHGYAALLAVLAIAPTVEAGGGDRLEVELLTMGRHDDLFARFGHAALWVYGQRGGRPVDIVYNYGFTHFDSSRLVWDFLRGRARFWVATSTFPLTVDSYREAQRGVFRHRLNLGAAQHHALAELLRINHLPKNRYYTYHHYHDNCATRLRDLIDRVTGGQLARQWKGKDPATPLTFRQLTREGFAGRSDVLLASELLLGRMVDRPLDRWQAAFLPRLLAAQLVESKGQQGQPLSGPSVRVVKGSEPVGDPLGGVWLLALLGAFATLLTALAAWGMRRRLRWAGLLLLPPGLLFGLSGALLASLAAIATLPELRFNELALLIWPTDLLLYLVIGIRMSRGRFHVGKLLRGLALGRVIVVALAACAHLVGLLYQQPRLWIVVAGLPALLLWIGVRQLASEPDAPYLASEGYSE